MNSWFLLKIKWSVSLVCDGKVKWHCGFAKTKDEFVVQKSSGFGLGEILHKTLSPLFPTPKTILPLHQNLSKPLWLLWEISHFPFKITPWGRRPMSVILPMFLNPLSIVIYYSTIKVMFTIIQYSPKDKGTMFSFIHSPKKWEIGQFNVSKKSCMSFNKHVQI